MLKRLFDLVETEVLEQPTVLYYTIGVGVGMVQGLVC